MLKNDYLNATQHITDSAHFICRLVNRSAETLPTGIGIPLINTDLELILYNAESKTHIPGKFPFANPKCILEDFAEAQASYGQVQPNLMGYDMSELSEEGAKVSRMLLSDILQHTFAQDPPVILSLDSAVGLPPMDDENAVLVVTNHSACNGSVCILSPLVQQWLTSRFLSDRYAVIPSSIHEVLVIPPALSQDISADDFRKMIRDVNAAEVPVKDRLSDELYMISKGRLEVYG